MVGRAFPMPSRHSGPAARLRDGHQRMDGSGNESARSGAVKPARTEGNRG